MDNQQESSEQGLFETKAGFREYLQMSKLRLTSLVVVTAVLGYIIAIVKTSAQFEIGQFVGLIIGGFLLTASSNTLNQIIEKDSDKLMSRTQNRPLATNRATVTESLVFAFITGILSLLLLGLALNATAAFLGFASLIFYAFLYTPLKKMSPIAVFVGAFPGAVPPMLGFVGATGQMSFEAVMIFGIQFFWQFPHFWSLAWVLHDDYQKAGYFMLPSRQGKSKKSAFQIWWYTLIMTIMSIAPFYTKFSGLPYLITAVICGTVMMWYGRILYKTLKDEDARKLMFASFLYIPIILLAMLF